jgi:hypothetical protein
MTDQAPFQFWLSKTRGLIRRSASAHPEVWRKGQWVPGSSYVMDAITGMGEDPYSCGEWADEITEPEAEAFAAKNGVDLHAPLAEDPPAGDRPTRKPRASRSSGT